MACYFLGPALLLPIPLAVHLLTQRLLAINEEMFR